MRAMPPILRAAHIEPTLAVTFIATALGVALGLGPAALWLAAAVLAGQLAVGWHNDWVDVERDRAAGRTDKPAAMGTIRVGVLPLLAGLAASGAALLSLPLGLPAAAAHAVAIAAALAYNARLKASWASVLPWAFAFGLLPVVVWLASGRTPPWWAVAAGSLLGVAAHCTNALPDLADDRRAGLRGLPHRLGPRGSVALAAGSAAAAAIAVTVGLAPRTPGVLVPLGGFLTALVVVVMVALRGGQRLAFRLTLAACAWLVAAVLATGALSRPG
jgi:4-hydroxybenzoate polyprenyltransferase